MLLDTTEDFTDTLNETLDSNIRSITFQALEFNLNLIIGFRCHDILITEESLPLVALICICTSSAYNRQINDHTMAFGFKTPAANHAKCLFLCGPCIKDLLDLCIIIRKINFSPHLYPCIIITKINICLRNSSVLNHGNKRLSSKNIILAVILDNAEPLNCKSQMFRERNREAILLGERTISTCP